MKVRKYVAIRHGSNTANQPMCEKAVLGIVEATERKIARLKVVTHYTVYNNQHIELIVESKASSRLWNEAAEMPLIS